MSKFEKYLNENDQPWLKKKDNTFKSGVYSGNDLSIPSTLPEWTHEWFKHFKSKFKNVKISSHFLERSQLRNLTPEEWDYMMKKLDKRLDLIMQTKSDSKIFKVNNMGEWEFKWQFKNFKSPKDKKYFRDIIGAVDVNKGVLKFISCLTPNIDRVEHGSESITNKMLIEKQTLNNEVLD